MNNVWFTADQHFNHKKIIELMKRPFKDIDEMNEALIDNHNRLVKPGDRVYHLGDFAWNDHGAFVKRLNGQHYLIKGNHDHRRNLTQETGFIWVKDTFVLKVGDMRFFLSHYPHRAWPESHYGSFHLYGHTHGMFENFRRSADVGVDAVSNVDWDYLVTYEPIHIDDVVAQLSRQPNTNHHPLEVMA